MRTKEEVLEEFDQVKNQAEQKLKALWRELVQITVKEATQTFAARLVSEEVAAKLKDLEQ